MIAVNRGQRASDEGVLSSFFDHFPLGWTAKKFEKTPLDADDPRTRLPAVPRQRVSIAERNALGSWIGDYGPGKSAS